MKTYRFLIKNTWIPIESGYANGYVAVPEGHPLYGKDYDDLNGIWVHGGLTYSGKMVPYHYDFELLDGELPQEYWCFGFDTAHWGDNLETCDRDFCINEVTRLQTQIEDYETIQKN
jgi:hypothetical protein